MSIPKPVVPGTVIRFRGAVTPRIAPSAAQTVAIPIVHDSGPVGSDPPGADGRQGGPQEVTSFDEFTALFGDSDTPGRTAVAGAFAGQGLDAVGGAGGVIVYRMAGASVAKATVNITTTGSGTPVGISLTAKYAGARANRVGYLIDVDPANSARDRLRITFDGAVQETYVYTQTDLVSLVAAINARSALVVAVDVIGTPARLTATSGTPVALAGGDDGSTLTSTEHTAAQTALEMQPFSILSVFDLTDPSLRASWVSWVQAQEVANRPIRFVVGGAAGEAAVDAIARSATIGDPHVINFGIGTWHDDLLNKDLSTSQLAPRVAGIVAACGERQDLTFRKISGLHAVGSTPPASDVVEAAIQGGVVTLMQAAAVDADVRIAKGVTTFTSTTDVNRPLDVFGDERLVGIMDNYIRAMKQWGDDIVIGALPVNDDTRDLVRGEARRREDILVRDGLVLEGDDITIPKPWVVCDDPKDPTLLDAIPYTFGWQFAHTANAVLGEGTIR